MLFLHGAGERGADNALQLADWHERGQAYDARNHRMIDLDATEIWLVIGLVGILRNRHAPDSCAFWEKVARRVRNSGAKYRPERGGREFFI